MWAGPGVYLSDRPDVWVAGMPLIYFWFLLWCVISIVSMLVLMWKCWYWDEEKDFEVYSK